MPIYLVYIIGGYTNSIFDHGPVTVVTKVTAKAIYTKIASPPSPPSPKSETYIT